MDYRLVKILYKNMFNSKKLLTVVHESILTNFTKNFKTPN